MSISVTQLLIQYGYLTPDHYSYAYQIQQSQPIETRQPLLQIYLEQGFLGVEHVDYCIKMKHQYISQGMEPDFNQELPEQEAYQQETQEQQSVATNCRVCLSEVQSGWASCPFCGTALQ